MTTLAPRLVIDGAAEAIDFYTRAFDATESDRFAGPDGQIFYVELHFDDVTLTLKDADDTDRPPVNPVIFILNTDDADALGAALAAAGATARFELSDMDYGDHRVRQGRYADPFNYQWLVSQPLP